MPDLIDKSNVLEHHSNSCVCVGGDNPDDFFLHFHITGECLPFSNSSSLYLVLGLTIFHSKLTFNHVTATYAVKRLLYLEVERRDEVKLNRYFSFECCHISNYLCWTRNAFSICKILWTKEQSSKILNYLTIFNFQQSRLQRALLVRSANALMFRRYRRITYSLCVYIDIHS